MTPSKSTEKDSGVTFVSTDANLRLVATPIHRRMNERGEWYSTEGKTIEFAGGRYSTDDKDEIKFLRDHRLNGAQGEAGAFVELGNEPDRIPDSGEVLEEIIDAAADKDYDRIAELYAQERVNHSRDEVLRAAARALEKADKEVPPPPEQPLHEQVRVRARGIVGAQPGEGNGPAVGQPPQPLVPPDENPHTRDYAQPSAPAGDGTDAGPQESGEVKFASEEAKSRAGNRTDLVPGQGSGKDGAYTVADLS